MTGYVGSKLIIVEGLTGLGKSIMAHFIARQLEYSGIPADWAHEGEEPHPILLDVESSIEEYGAAMRGRYAAFAGLVAAGDQVRVVEGCLFNNCLEFLLAHNVDRLEVIRYADELQALVEPLDPTLVYLVHEDLEAALARAFANRGRGFQEYVIEYATGTPLARQRGWVGYDGMVAYWREFVALTDELFQRYRIRKVRVDCTAGDWEAGRRQALACLSLPQVVEPRLAPGEAARLVGVYRDRASGREFTVRYEDGELTADLFLEVRTRLVGQPDQTFLTEGWHFEVRFEPEGPDGARVMRIGGRDIDYLHLAGTVAGRVSAGPRPG